MDNNISGIFFSELAKRLIDPFLYLEIFFKS